MCPGMKVHGHESESVSQAVYLGDIISCNGTNTSNVKSRTSKGMGQVNTIMTMLKAVSFGEKYFEIALTLREALLINGMLGSSDVWYGLKKSEIEEFEEVDKILLRKFLMLPAQAP